jgi:hypothetical protein
MKKKIILGLLLAVAASGIIFIGCDLFMPKETGGSTAYDPLIIRGRGPNGEEVEIEFTTTRTVPRAVLTPQTGDSYELRKDGRVTSSGKIEVDETHIIFKPSNGDRQFVASYVRGDDYITLFEIPDDNGELVTGLGPTTPGFGSGGSPSGGGGGGGGGSSRPYYDVVAITQAAVIGVLGNNAIRGAGNNVTLGGDTNRVTSNVSIHVPLIVESETEMPVRFTIGSEKEVMFSGTGSLTVREGDELIITGGGTLRIAGTALNIDGKEAKLTVDPGTRLIITNDGTTPAAVNIDNGGEVTVKGGDIDIYTAVTVSSSATDPVANPATMRVASGNVNVYTGGYLTIGGGGVLDLDATASTRPPKLNISGTGVVEISGSGLWDPKDDLDNPLYGAVSLRGSAEFIVPSGPDQDSLNQAIIDVKKVTDRGGNYQGKVVVKLTGGEGGFYGTFGAGGTYIQVDVKQNSNTDIPDTLENRIPYTIRGQGIGAGDTPLNVGIWLANDNITLENVKFNIATAAGTIGDDKDTGVVPKDAFATSIYNAAVMIGRRDDSNKAGTTVDLLAHNYADVWYVTVRNCIVNITGGTGFTAGIWVMGRYVTIEGNIVTAKGSGTSSVQALGFMRWNSGLVVRNNDLKAEYSSWRNPAGGNTWNAPASSIFINMIFELAQPYSGWSISNNKLYCDYDNTPNGPLSCFSFFVNSAIPIVPGDRSGVKDMRDNNFGSSSSTWVTYPRPNPDTRSDARRIIDALIYDNINTRSAGKGFGTVTLVLDSGWDGLNEGYTITNGRISNITHWGYNVVQPGGNQFSNALNPAGNIIIDADGNRSNGTASLKGMWD